MKFTDSGGAVTVVMDEVVTAPQMAHARIRVSDNGVGIDAQHIPLLFKRFGQLDRYAIIFS